MPSASTNLQYRMTQRFGSIDMEGPIKYLTDRGYILGEDWHWSRPNTDYDQMTEEEYECLLFLVYEWDFGGLHIPGEQNV